MTMTVTIAQTHLDAWLAADLAVSQGQAYTIENRSLTRADAKMILDRISYWQNVVNALTAQNAGGKSPGIRVATWN